jgi:hypothetical protein
MFHAKPRNILPLCTPSEAERSPSEVEGLTERSRGGGGMYIGVLVSASLDEQFMSVAEERFFHFIFHLSLFRRTHPDLRPPLAEGE